MKTTVDAYVGIWILTVLFMLCLSFTSINMRTNAAKKMYGDLKSQIQATNGQYLGDDAKYEFDSTNLDDLVVEHGSEFTGSDDSVRNQVKEQYARTISDNGYSYKYTVELLNDPRYGIADDSQTFIYNNMYKLSLEYSYTVPFFGKQVYRVSGYTY